MMLITYAPPIGRLSFRTEANENYRPLSAGRNPVQGSWGDPQAHKAVIVTGLKRLNGAGREETLANLIRLTGQHPNAEVNEAAIKEAFGVGGGKDQDQPDRTPLLVKSWLELNCHRAITCWVGFCVTTSRWLLFGDTGIGKTLLAMDIAAAVASGAGLLNWAGSGQPHNVLYLDGEMPAETVKERVKVVADRYGNTMSLWVYSRDVLSDRGYAAAQWRGRGEMAEAGSARLETRPDHL